MAKKKAAKPAKKKANGSNGSPEIKWFSRQLHFLAENKGLTIAQRQANAQEDCKRLLTEHPKGKNWEITDFDWEKPNSPSEKFKLTVWIKWLKPKTPPSPNDAPIPAKKQPPPGM